MTNMFVNIADLKEENGKTIRENNLDKKHNIPINTLVEVEYEEWYGNGASSKTHARLFVFKHTRDCNGTPLYTLSTSQKQITDSIFRKQMEKIHPLLAEYVSDKIAVRGIREEDLKIIEITDNILSGKDTIK